MWNQERSHRIASEEGTTKQDWCYLLFLEQWQFRLYCSFWLSNLWKDFDCRLIFCYHQNSDHHPFSCCHRCSDHHFSCYCHCFDRHRIFDYHRNLDHCRIFCHPQRLSRYLAFDCPLASCYHPDFLRLQR